MTHSADTDLTLRALPGSVQIGCRIFQVRCSVEFKHSAHFALGNPATQMDRLNASLISCLDGFGCMGIIQQWLPGVAGEDVIIDQRRFRVIKLVSSTNCRIELESCLMSIFVLAR